MKFHSLAFILLPLTFIACGDDGATPWAGDTLNVRGPDGELTELSGGDCGDLTESACDAARAECGESGAADVYVNDAGEVTEVICYPNAAGDDVTTLSGGDEAPEIGNGDTIVLSGDAENPAFEGDLTLDGNNVTLYGDDPADAVIDGNLNVEKNNGLISGVTVTGNLEITGENTSLSNCVIDGNLIIKANNAVVAGCTINGNIEVKANNTRLTANTVDGNIEDEGKNTELTDNTVKGDGGQ